MLLLKKCIAYLTLIAIAVTLSACDDKDSPEVVSQHFWSAIQENDTATAQNYAVPGSLSGQSLRIENDQFISSFGETTINGNQATVSTTHTGSYNNAPLDYQFNTTLIKIEDEWKVDVEKTTQSLVPAAMSAAFSGLGQALNQSLSNLGEAFGKEADNIGTLLGQALNDGVEQMSREMEKASAELSQSAEYASDSGFAAATEFTKEFSQELNQELQNAGSIYQQKLNELKAAQRKKASSKTLPASVQGHIHNTPISFTKARYQQALELYSGDNWSNNPSVLIFLFLADNESLAGKTLSYSADATPTSSNNPPHIHLRWRAAESNELETEIISQGYNLKLAFSDADTQGNITATVALTIENPSSPDNNSQIHGSFQLNSR